MLFLSPLALFGLAAALVPPLLHLFQRRRPPEVEFPAVRYLQQTEREAQRQVRLQHLLLMALRILAVVLVVLAAARPVVPGSGMALHEPTAVAIVLDNSLSSGTVAGGTRVLDDLALRARETLREAQAGDALWLIQADGIARRGTPQELIAAVAAVRPDGRRLDLSEAVSTAAGLVAGAGYARTEVHVLSDLQQSAVGSGQLAVDVPVLVYHPLAEPPANRGIAAVSPRPAVWIDGGSVLADVVGNAEGSPSALQLTLDERAGGRALASPGTQAVLAAPRAAPGWHSGVVSLESDELRSDDDRFFAVRAVTPTAIAAPAEDEVGPFVVSAVQVLNERQSAVGSGQSQSATIGTSVRGRYSIVLPPADPARLGSVNRDLAAAGVPWRFGSLVTRDDSLVSATVAEVQGARVSRRYRLEAVGVSDSSEVLARAGNDPWLVRHGTIVVAASRLVPEHTTLPLSGGFVPFISALANRISRGESGVLEATAGQPVALPARVDALVSSDSTIRVQRGSVIEPPAAPGVYAMLAGRDTAGLMVVGFDARESDLSRATDQQVAGAWGRATITSDAERYGALRFRGAGLSELTGWLLIAALGVLVVESLVAAGALRRLGA